MTLVPGSRFEFHCATSVRRDLPPDGTVVEVVQFDRMYDEEHEMYRVRAVDSSYALTADFIAFSDELLEITNLVKRLEYARVRKERAERGSPEWYDADAEIERVSKALYDGRSVSLLEDAEEDE